MVLFSQNTYTQIIPEGKVRSISIVLSSHKETLNGRICGNEIFQISDSKAKK